MPETPEGKILMAKIEQKLIDHETTQARDMSELKTGQARIETKIDNIVSEKIDRIAQDKADRKELNNMSNMISSKTDNAEFLFWRNLFVSGILINILLMLLSIYLAIKFKG